MKKIKDNGLLIVLNILVFIFFLGFVYFSYFTAKELLVLRYVNNIDYSYKFNHWELQECKDPYSYKYRDPIENIRLNKNEKTKSFDEIKRECLGRVYEKSENKKLADFKFNFIKYGLATLFFFILFVFFAAQHISFYKKKK